MSVAMVSVDIPEGSRLGLCVNLETMVSRALRMSQLVYRAFTSREAR